MITRHSLSVIPVKAGIHTKMIAKQSLKYALAYKRTLKSRSFPPYRESIMCKISILSMPYGYRLRVGRSGGI